MPGWDVLLFIQEYFLKQYPTDDESTNFPELNKGTDSS